MEKLSLKTNDLTAENIAKLSALFPEIITEVVKGDKIIKTINSDKLKELIGDYADNSSEVYELSWAGKQKSRQKIVKHINKTLRPVPEDSVDFENTENLYIEGDNFEVLKLLQESYLNKIKMIYIDPPYNTGNDFVYKDNFAMSTEKYEEETGALDEEGNKLFRNTIANGRFHSNWLSMMYERLVIAKDLLRDDGVIFISIDNNEVANLKKICDEVFGEGNFVGDIIRKTKSTTNDAKSGLNIQHEYCFIYAKIASLVQLRGDIKSFESYSNPDNDQRGEWVSSDPTATDDGRKTKNLEKIVNPYTGKEDIPGKGRRWAFNNEGFQKLVSEKRIIFKKNHGPSLHVHRHSTVNLI